MKAHLLDGEYAGEVLNIEEMAAELIVEKYQGDHTRYFLKGFSSDLELEYISNYQSIVQDLLILNGNIQHPVEAFRPSEAEIRWELDRGLMLPGRAISIMTGVASGQANAQEDLSCMIVPCDQPLIPCLGSVLGWFLPGSLPTLKTHNLSLLVRLPRQAPLLLEITKFHFLLGENIEGSFANIKPTVLAGW